MENTGQVVDPTEEFDEPTDNEKELIEFVIEHTDRWRDYRDQNFLDDWEKYERAYNMKWDASDKVRDSERSRVISPATHQAVQTRHTEIMEAIFGQGEYFDISDDIRDVDGSPIDVEQLKKQLYEDFAQDKIVKSISQIELLAEIYGTGIAEIVVGKEKKYIPKQVPVPNQPNQVAYGVQEEDRFYVRLVPVNPKNFIFDPNGSSVDECMGVAIERYVSSHKIMEGIASGKYRKVDLDTTTTDERLEPTQESISYKDDKVKILTYYGLAPKEYLDSLKKDDEGDQVEELFNESVEDYVDMVESIIIIANGSLLLKAEETPYMMKDRPILTYQDDTVPNRLLGKGTVEKCINMQAAIDGSMRSHMDSLALTSAPMVAMDATRLPRGAKFEVKPGKAILMNGDPASSIMPFQFGVTDGQSMAVSKDFERQLLMATGTLDAQGMVQQGSRDAGGLSIAASGIIKRYKRALVNFQEDFLIPFIYKAAYRYMQFNPERYPAVDLKFNPTASLGIIAREYEQQQLAFIMQTLGSDSPLTPILMKGILHNSSLTNREELMAQIDQMSQPDPQSQQVQLQKQALELQFMEAQANESMAKANMNNALAQLNAVKAQLEPDVVKAEQMAAMTKNLPTNDQIAQQEFERRVKVSSLMLKEEEINAKKKMVEMQMEQHKQQQANSNDYIDKVKNAIGG